MITLASPSNPSKSLKSGKRTFYTSKRIIALRKSLPPATPTRLLISGLKILPWTPTSSASGLAWGIISGSYRIPAPISSLKDTVIAPSRPAKLLITVVERNSASRPLYSRIYGRSCRSAVFEIYYYFLSSVIFIGSTPPISFGGAGGISKNIVTALNPCIRSILDIRSSASGVIISNLSSLCGRSWCWFLSGVFYSFTGMTTRGKRLPVSLISASSLNGRASSVIGIWISFFTPLSTVSASKALLKSTVTSGDSPRSIGERCDSRRALPAARYLISRPHEIDRETRSSLINVRLYTNATWI